MGTGSCREGRNSGKQLGHLILDPGLRWLMFTEHVTELHTLNKPKEKESLSPAALGNDNLNPRGWWLWRRELECSLP